MQVIIKIDAATFRKLHILHSTLKNTKKIFLAFCYLTDSHKFLKIRFMYDALRIFVSSFWGQEVNHSQWSLL